MAPTTAKDSWGELKRPDQPAAGGGGVLGIEHVGERLEDLVAALRGARAGADDLHQQRLRELGVLGQGAEEGARSGPQPLPGVADRRVARRLGHRRLHELGAHVEQRQHALLLVGEVLVERRLRHPGAAADRLRAGAGVATIGELTRGRAQQALALQRQPDLWRRRVPAPGARPSSSLQRAAVMALVVLAVRARADRLPPPGVVAVPLDRAREPVVEPRPRPPAQAGELVGGERVAAVVAGPVGHVFDQRFVGSGQLQDPVHDLDVLALVRTAAVVDLTGLAMSQDVADPASEVLHVEPVAHVAPIAVDGEVVAAPAR